MREDREPTTSAIEKLERREKPALPASYLWTWDHSTNWLGEGLRWLTDALPGLSGENLEDGDFLTCSCLRSRRGLPAEPGGEAELSRVQAMSYVPAARALEPFMTGRLVSQSPYTGFLPGHPPPERVVEASAAILASWEAGTLGDGDKRDASELAPADVARVLGRREPRRAAA